MRYLRYILAFSTVVWLTAAIASARTPERKASLSYGVEWGYTSTLMHVYHHNYIADEGYRVDLSGIEACYNSNGQIFGHLGVNFAEHYNVSCYFGYIGIKQERHILPLTARATYFLKPYHQDGLLVFADGGLGIHDSSHNTFIGKAGWGYRLALSSKLNLDFKMSFQIANDHPTVYDPNEQEIQEEFLRRNDATYGAINFNVAISF